MSTFQNFRIWLPGMNSCPENILNVIFDFSDTILRECENLKILRKTDQNVGFPTLKLV